MACQKRRSALVKRNKELVSKKVNTVKTKSRVHDSKQIKLGWLPATNATTSFIAFGTWDSIGSFLIPSTCFFL